MERNRRRKNRQARAVSRLPKGAVSHTPSSPSTGTKQARINRGKSRERHRESPRERAGRSIAVKKELSPTPAQPVR